MSVAGLITCDRDLNETCEQILGILLPYWRVEEWHEHPKNEYHWWFAHQYNVIRDFVSEDAPITFTLPAFPCKSPNRKKTLSSLPDMGELLSLRFLDGLCKRIKEIYEPGARMLICSDGHVFGDLIRVPDAHIDSYGNALRAMIETQGLDNIDTFSLEHVYGACGYDDKRRLLMAEFGEPAQSLRAEVHAGGAIVSLYRGVTRFLLEDAAGYEGSRAALQRECRARAYEVIRRSRAWGELVARHHPRSLRMSIHPQSCGSAKFGIALLDSLDSWLTPWHSVALQCTDGRFVLMKRTDAEQVGELVYRNGLPSHYVVASAA